MRVNHRVMNKRIKEESSISGPPRLASIILAHMLEGEIRCGAMGDLEEDFRELLLRHGYPLACLVYWVQFLIAVPGFFLNKVYWGIVMLKSYLKLTFRNLVKNKGYSLINIFGLTISLALGFVIMQVIDSLHMYDEFHENKHRIYRVASHRSGTDWEGDYASSPLPLAQALSQECPGIEHVVRMKTGLSTMASFESMEFSLYAMFVDAAFFDVFSFDLTLGDPEVALDAPYSIVLTQEMADKFFGNKNPLGKILYLDGYGDYTVQGVLDDTQGYYSHIHIRPLISASTLPLLELQGKIRPCLDRWEQMNNHYVYFMLEKGVPVSQVMSLLPRYGSRHFDAGDINVDFYVQSLRDILPGHSLRNNLGTDAPMFVLTILWVVAILVAMTAGFNYTNLTIAKALTRSREVGIRKVVGAKRRQLFVQLIGEAVVFSLVSLILAYGMYRSWLVPSFFRLHPMFSQVFFFKENIRLILYFTGFSILTGIAAGCLPALYMSRFEPLKVLRGFQDIRLFSRITLRKSLIVFQFTISLVFIIGSLVSLKQMQYIQDMDKGFNPAHVVNVERSGVDTALFRPRIIQDAAVLDVSTSDYLPGLGATGYVRVWTESAEDTIRTHSFCVDRHFLENLQLQLVAGVAFSKEFTEESESAIIINQKMAERLGYTGAPDVLGELLFLREKQPMKITGVVRDFSQDKLDRELSPSILRCRPDRAQYINIRLQPGDEAAAISRIQQEWEALFPNTPFRYRYYEDRILEDISNVQIMMKVMRFIAVLAMIVSCMGLMGIAEYHGRTKVKEIGIRKVLGAGNVQIVQLLSKEFITILIIAIIIATPLSHLMNTAYFQIWERHVPLKLHYYMTGIGLLLLFGLSSVLSQTIRAARGRPVEALKYE